MPKEIRFSKLVQIAGKPETVTLWSKPKDNPAFMTAMTENRVVTVIQKPAGTRKDFGIVGFHQEKFASYLIFPKRLPKIDEGRVIGINYGLLREPMAKPGVKKIIKPTSPGRESFAHDGHSTRDGAVKMKSKAEAAKKYEVRVMRTGTLETPLAIDAASISDAEKKALQIIKESDFQPNDVHDQVKSIARI